MIMLKTRSIASVIAVFLLIYPQAHAAEIFKSSEFLKWTDDNKSFYIRTSVGMASLIARYNDEEHAKCIEKWYFSNEDESNNYIYGVMQKYSNDHPRGLIFAVLKKYCGTFIYSDRKS